MSSSAKPVPKPLISVQQLDAELNAPDLLLIDTRFKLEDTAYGQAAYDAGHIPGAVYMDLDRDLSSPVVPEVTGRHPLPDPAVLEARLREIGLRKTDHVVIYDDGPGVYPSRLWWLLNWLGHSHVSVLDGGLTAWNKAGLTLSSEVKVRPWPGDFVGHPDNSLLISAEDLLKGDARWQLLDARAQERFRGEVEPIDPIAGHIPGAQCFPFAANLGADGLWLAPDVLRARFPAIKSDQQRVCYCGSGVTACHNILAAVLAGLPMPKLYAGSWSEWITDPSRPVATG
jgi:thiosulfate/3-mercaptopyruvate sulfurtransferase